MVKWNNHAVEWIEWMMEALVAHTYHITLVANWLLDYFLKLVLVYLSATLCNTFKQLCIILVDMTT